MSTKVSSASVRSELAALNDRLDQRAVSAAARATVLEAIAIAQSSDIAVVTDVPEDDVYVVLRAPGGPVAAYVHPDRLRLRFDRRRALRTCQEYEFCQLERGTDSSAPALLLHIDSWAVEQHAIIVRRLLLSALMIASMQAAEAAADAANPRAGRAVRRPSSLPRRTSEPSRGSGTAGPVAARPPKPAAAPRATSRTRAAALPPPPPPPKPAVCPTHFVQLVNGRCDYCDY